MLGFKIVCGCGEEVEIVKDPADLKHGRVLLGEVSCRKKNDPELYKIKLFSCPFCKEKTTVQIDNSKSINWHNKAISCLTEGLFIQDGETKATKGKRNKLKRTYKARVKHTNYERSQLAIKCDGEVFTTEDGQLIKFRMAAFDEGLEGVQEIDTV